MPGLSILEKETIWHLDKVVMADVRERCTRQPVQNVKKNVKFLSNRAETVRFTAGNVFQSAMEAAAKR